MNMTFGDWVIAGIGFTIGVLIVSTVLAAIGAIVMLIVGTSLPL